jgi:dolichol-phosphate mannosyltransferase
MIRYLRAGKNFKHAPTIHTIEASLETSLAINNSQDASKKRRTVIVIPTYNERENLPNLILQLRCIVPTAHILVVDDNSPDGTGVFACELSERDPNLHVLHRERKEGLGRAYIAGFSWALTYGYDYIVQMDADLSHNPSDVPRLIAILESENAGLVIGSRYVKGGGTMHWGLGRQLLSRLGNLYARGVLGIPLNDLTGGFKCWRRETLESLDLSSISSNGYSFQVEMNYRVHKKHGKMLEVPIVFTDRYLGQSKMHKGIILEAFLLILRMRNTSIHH